MMNFGRYTISCVVVTTFVGCAGSPTWIGAPPSMPRAIQPGAYGANVPQYGVLYSFGRHGRNPDAQLCYLNGTFFGTAAYGGGKNGIGVVFAITPRGDYNVLHVFRDTGPGNEPYGGLTAVHGKLFGTTYSGGTYGYGTIFRISTTGEYRSLYSFNFSDPAIGSAGPLGSFVDVNGVLYGTTVSGGSSNDGTVYSAGTSGNVRTLHYFNGSDGAIPEAGLINVNGTLYGTTMKGGAHNKGTVYRISTTGAEKAIFSFDGADGQGPVAPLIVVNGKLYGTTAAGGSANLGTVFRMSLSGKEEAVVHSFGNENGDGVWPEAGLLDVGGTLYGTTVYGGAVNRARCYGGACGTIFSVTAAGTERVLHRFRHEYRGDGAFPMASLIDVSGRFYGTTQNGGHANNGTVFDFTR